jgi:hypothetical protein
VHYDSRPLGHDKLDTTARYTRVATGLIANIKSPPDMLAQPRKKVASLRTGWTISISGILLSRHAKMQVQCYGRTR